VASARASLPSLRVNVDNKAIILRLLDAMDHGELSIVDELCSPDLKVHFNDQELNIVQVKQASEGFQSAFPDLKHTIEEIAADGERVALRARDRATHLGEYRGIAPTGRVVEFQTMAVYRIRDGKIEEIWQQMDTDALLRSLT
jgi:predicted ester cyclase